MIKNGKWCKEHVLHGIQRVCQNPQMIAEARRLDAYEFGTYRGETTQLIDNTFYAYQFPIKNLWGIDSFEGLPAEAKEVERFYLFNEGFFNDVGNQLYPLRPNGYYVKAWFKDLNENVIRQNNWAPAAFIHIDGDLYISCLEALTFMFDNNLVIPGTVIAFDEFKSTSTLEAGGESKAWFELCEKYKIEAVEFFRNVYFDQLECWQNAFEIKSIGTISKTGLLDEIN